MHLPRETDAGDLLFFQSAFVDRFRNGFLHRLVPDQRVLLGVTDPIYIKYISVSGRSNSGAMLIEQYAFCTGRSNVYAEKVHGI